MGLFDGRRQANNQPAEGDCLCQHRGFTPATEHVKFEEPQFAHYAPDIVDEMKQCSIDKCNDLEVAEKNCNCGENESSCKGDSCGCGCKEKEEVIVNTKEVLVSDNNMDVLLEAISLILTKVDHIEEMISKEINR